MGTHARTDAEHKAKMRTLQAAQAKKIAAKTVEKGLVIVHTGPGKGKSTAAFGMAMRAIGHGMQVGIVQFVKGSKDTGEQVVLDHFPDRVEFLRRGEASPGTRRTVRAISRSRAKAGRRSSG